MSNNREYWNRMSYTSTASSYSPESLRSEIDRAMIYKREYPSPLSELREIKAEKVEPMKDEPIPTKKQEILFDPEELDL